ncbi:MAG: hypothetical protein IJ673_12705 [Treponema sp.]|nr:hypothetical protein [Treponema sp.]
MTLKDFSVGQTAYIIGDTAHRTSTNKGITEVTVEKIGRKYVTVKRGTYEIRFGVQGETKPYLVENTEYGAPRLLFPSEEDMNRYNELCDLKRWVGEAAGWSKIGRYSLEQLRAVKKILEGEV